MGWQDTLKKVVGEIGSLRKKISSPQPRVLRQMETDFILIRVAEEPFSLLPDRLRILADIASMQPCFIKYTFLGSIVLMAMTPQHKAQKAAKVPPEQVRKTLVSLLIEHFGDSIAVIHGRQQAFYGILGGHSILAHHLGFLFPGTQKHLWDLLTLPWGEVRDVTA